MKRLLIIVILSLCLYACEENTSQGNVIENEEIIAVIDDIVEAEIIEDEIVEEIEAIEETDLEAVVAIERLNIRDEATLDAEVIGTALLDESYVVVDQVLVEDRLWYEIQFDDQTGWIASWFTVLVHDKMNPVEVYNHPDDQGDLVAIIDLDILEEMPIGCIELHDQTLRYWGRYESGDVTGYYLLSRYDYLKAYPEETMILKNGNKEDTITFDDFKLSHINDDRQKMFYVDDEYVFVDPKNGVMALQDKSIEGPESKISEYHKIYSNGYTTIYQSRNICLIEDKILDYKTNFREGTYEALEFSLVDGVLSRATRKEFYVLPSDEVIYVLKDGKYQYTTTKDELNKYTCDRIVIEIDGFSSQKFYETVIDGQVYQVKNGFDQVPDQTWLLRGGLEPLKLQGDITVYSSPFYNKNLVEAKKYDQMNVLDLDTLTYLPYDYISYSSNGYIATVYKGKAYVYNMEDLDHFIYSFDIEETFSECIWLDDRVAFQFSSNKGVGYVTGQVILEIDHNEVVVIKDEQKPVLYDRIVEGNPVKSYDYERSLSFRDITLVMGDKLSLTAVLEDLYYRKHLIDAYELRYNFYFSDIVDDQGQIILSNDHQNSISYVSEDRNNYVIYSGGYYLYNKQTGLHELGSVYKYSDDYFAGVKEENDGFMLYVYNYDGVLLDRAEVDTLDLRYVNIIDDVIYVTGEYDYEVTAQFKPYADAFKIINQELQLIEDETTYTVYDGPGTMYNQVDTVDIIDASVETMNIYESINGQMNIWFKVKYNNLEGYVVRPFTKLDNPGYAYETYQVYLTDGTLKDVRVSGDCTFKYLTDELGPQGYQTGYYSWEGSYGDFMSLKTGEFFPVIDSPILSPNKDYFYSYTNGYYVVNSESAIYSINDEKIERIIELYTNSWAIKDVNWLSNEKLKVELYLYDYNITNYMIVENINGQWQKRIE